MWFAGRKWSLKMHEWSFVCHHPQLGDVSGVCMQSHCLALRSQLVHECQSWKRPVFRGHLSQLLTSKVIPPSLGGAGPQAEPGPALRTPVSWFSALSLHCSTSMWLSGCPCVCDVWCECRAMPRVGGDLCSTDRLSSELMDPLHRQ